MPALRHTANRVRLCLPAVFTAALLLPAVVESQATSAPKKYTTADVAFMQGMIGHHAQALEMTALIAARLTIEVCRASKTILRGVKKVPFVAK